MTTTALQRTDCDTLLSLNADYVRSAETSDVDCFARLLAPDFVCTYPDGSVADRTTFLARAAAPATVSSLRADDVAVRLFGDIAIIHARTTFVGADGKPGWGRYTDVWARRGGRWLAVAAQFTRAPAA
jgi:ketosteroid isomerase-like protein